MKKQSKKIGVKNKTSLFRRVGVWVFQSFFEGNRKLCSQEIRTALNRVEQGNAREEEYYYAEKVAKVLTVIVVGILIVLLLGAKYYIDQNEAMLTQVNRNEYGEDPYYEVLTASKEDGEVLGVYEFSVESRKYTPKETQIMFDEAAIIMPDVLKGHNESLQCVTEKLNTVSKLEGFPFSISWNSSNYFRIKNDGTPTFEGLDEKGEEVILTATYSYYDSHYEQEFLICVCRPTTAAEQAFRDRVNEKIQQAQEETAYDTYFVLPSEVDGTKIYWSTPVSSSVPLVLVLVVAASIAIWFGFDSALMKKMKIRREELLMDYAGFVSRLTLFFSAGMTVRSIFEKMAKDYETKRDQGGEKRYLYEEIMRAVYALEGGYHEEEVYSLFASGCGLQEYTRLMTLLTQNLRKGQGQLLSLLSKEAAEAGAKRLDDARVRGEQAGTKLMFPMMLMLFIVMILIMIPAYMSF